jgi:hypothetical protein
MNLKSFDEVTRYPYVIIYDNANGNKLHKTSCSFVTEENFNIKVIENQGKSGYYRPLKYYEDIRDASVTPCKVCKPTQNNQ